MFGFSAFATRAFNSLTNAVIPPSPDVWGSKGGLGRKKKEHIRKSARSEMQDHVKELFAEPVAAELKEQVAKYVKPSQGLSIHSIDYGKLAQDVELVQQIIGRFQEMQQEQEDEALLLMLM
jgi:nucleotidyltransferase/DNA polymerase involved in DNA repair